MTLYNEPTTTATPATARRRPRIVQGQPWREARSLLRPALRAARHHCAGWAGRVTDGEIAATDVLDHVGDLDPPSALVLQTCLYELLAAAKLNKPNGAAN
jgi:hypothetical protein